MRLYMYGEARKRNVHSCWQSTTTSMNKNNKTRRCWLSFCRKESTENFRLRRLHPRNRCPHKTRDKSRHRLWKRIVIRIRGGNMSRGEEGIGRRIKSIYGIFPSVKRFEDVFLLVSTPSRSKRGRDVDRITDVRAASNALNSLSKSASKMSKHSWGWNNRRKFKDNSNSMFYMNRHT